MMKRWKRLQAKNPASDHGIFALAKMARRFNELPTANMRRRIGTAHHGKWRYWSMYNEVLFNRHQAIDDYDAEHDRFHEEFTSHTVYVTV